MSKLDVGFYAGAITYLLENENELSVTELEQISNCKPQQVLLALGWLARDNRIVVINNKNHNWSVRLNRFPMTEIHY